MPTQDQPATAVPPFLLLPTEIQYEIYRLVLVVPAPRLRRKEVNPKKTRPRSSSRIHEGKDKPELVSESVESFTQLARVCHQVYHEVFPFLYSHATLSSDEPFDFANRFLRHLDPIKISQLRNIEFDIGPISVKPSVQDFERPKIPKFDHILTVFEHYPELENLDMLKIKGLGPWAENTFINFDLDCMNKSTEVTRDELSSCPPSVGKILFSDKTTTFFKTALKLAGGSLKGCKIFIQVAKKPQVLPKEKLWWAGGIYSITFRKVDHTAGIMANPPY